MTARILLIRHARSSHIERGWIDFDGFLRWREAYEAAGILAAEVAPEALRALAVDAVVAASNAPRAVATARLLSGGEVIVSPLLREMELAPPRLRGLRMPLVVLAIVFGVFAVIRGHATEAELRRAQEAAALVDGLARERGTALVVTHGAFRVHLARALEARGWRGDGARRRSRHWSAWTLTA